MPRLAGYVYVVEGDGRVKIGWTRDPRSRIASLERETGEQVYLWALVRGTRDDESAAHSRWAHLSLGGEWFRTTDELLAWAEALEENA